MNNSLKMQILETITRTIIACNKQKGYNPQDSNDCDYLVSKNTLDNLCQEIASMFPQ